MQKNKFILPLVFLASLFFVFYNVNYFWSGSGDLALHYGLIYRIQENLSLIGKYDPSIQVMSYYPPFSHAIASILGLIFKSTFLGMQLTILFAVSLIWGSIYFILSRLPNRVFVISIILLAIFIVINGIFNIVNIHGGEIIGNFFYSHIVGQAILFLTLAVAINFSYHNKKNLIFISLFIGLVVLTCTHLMPALQVLCIMSLLLLEENIINFYKKIKDYKLIFIYSILLLSISVLSILFNPWYILMKKVANNNGGLNTLNVSFPLGIMFLAIFCIILGVYLYVISIKKSQYSSFKYLGFYGFSTGILCLLQEIALVFFGAGSEYAVKKYIFSLNSFFIISISCILAYLINNIFEAKAHLKNIFTKENIFNYFLPVFLLMIMLFTLPLNPILKVADVVKIEQHLIEYKKTVIPIPETGKSDIVVNLDNMPKSINWMFSMAIAMTPFDLSVHDSFINSEINDYSLYSTIIAGKSNKMLSFSGCNNFKSDITAYNGDCVRKFLIQASSCKNQFDFSSSGFISGKQLKGFSVAENDGRWTDGNSAEFTCLTNGSKFSRIVIELNPFLYSSHDKLNFIMVLNGSKKYDYSLTKEDINKPISIDISNIREAPEYSIDFQILNPISPKALGMSDDTRNIGVKIKKISFY